MPSDPHSFDEIKLPSIFVPHGAPEPTELLGGYADWIKLPAALEPNSRSDRQADRPTGARTPGQRSPASGHTATADPAAPVPQPPNAVLDEAQATFDMRSMSSGLLAAHQRASHTLATIASSHPSGDYDGDGPDASTGTAMASDAASADRTHTEYQLLN